MTCETPIAAAGLAPPALDPDWLALPMWEKRHRELAGALEIWLTEADDAIEEAAALPPEEAARRLLALLADGGWLEIAVPPAGAPLDLRAVCLCRAAFAHREDLLDFAFSIQALAAYPLRMAADAGQLAALREGCAVGALALSEPQAGSELGAVATEARPVEDGWRLTGRKAWIGNAGAADLVCVLARTGGPGSIGLGLFAVPGDAPGLAQEGGLALSAPRAFGGLVLDGCHVPQDALIGAPGMGYALALGTLDAFRPTVGAAATGFASRALASATAHARARRIGDGPLSDTQIARVALTDMATELAAARALVLQAAWEADVGRAVAPARAAQAKLLATETAQRVVDRALQLHGAAGCVAGSLPERLYRQVRSLRIYEGTSEIQRLVIGGAIASGRLC